MKKVLIIQLRPENETSDAEFQAFINVGGIDENRVERVRAEQVGLDGLVPSDYSAIIVGGSPFDFTTPENDKSPIQKKLETQFRKFMKEVVDKDIPFLGACSGSGILGSYLGEKITQKYGEPVEGLDVYLTEEGRKDKLLLGFPHKFRALAGHKEALESAPPGSVMLAYSKTCPVHMFRAGKNVYATQFHPESDPEQFKLRIEVYKHHGYFNKDDAEKLAKKVDGEDTPYAKQILKNFVSHYVY